MLKFVTIIVLMLFVIGSFYLINFLEKKHVLPNRWILGFLSFLVVFLPMSLFPNLPMGVRYMLYVLCGFLAIGFFEKTRLLLEKGKYPGMVKYEQPGKENEKK